MDQSEMSTSKNKSKSGLRMLWIPGRKKHQHKGRYDTTNRQIDYSGKQKNTEPWSLGGTKNQEMLFKSEQSGNSELTNIGPLLPSTCVITAAGSSKDSTVTMKLDEDEQNKFSILETENENQENITKTKDPEPNEHCLLDKRDNTETLPMNDKKDFPQNIPKDDINSIENADKNPIIKQSNFDLTDSSLYNVNKGENGKRKSKKKKKKNKKHTDDNNEDEKAVKCLYYTLMCCECTIS